MEKSRGRVKSGSNVAISLAFMMFRNRIELLSRTYWNLSAACTYSRRYWAAMATNQRPKFLRDTPGDCVDPFRRLQGVDEHLAALPEALRRALASSIFDTVVALETYLMELTARLVLVKPSVLDSSKKQVLVADVFRANPPNIRTWLAAHVADDHNRNKVHRDVIVQLGTWLQAGYAKEDQCLAAWHRWTVARNALAHAAGFATPDLVIVWPERFGTAGKLIDLNESDLSTVTALAAEIAQKLDRGYCALAGHADADQLAAEHFILHGDADGPGGTATYVSRVRCISYPKNRAEKTIAAVKRGAFVADTDTARQVALECK